MIKPKMRLIRTQSDTLDEWIASNYESQIRGEFDDKPPIDQVKIDVLTLHPDDHNDFLIRFSSDAKIIFIGIDLEYFGGILRIFDGSFFDEFKKQFTELYALETSIIRAHMYCAYIEKLNDDIIFYIRNIILSEYNSNYL